jgi:glycosyltransferase involved in cell wall biosynthesis
MRILHTNFHRGWGGQSNRILLLCQGLRERGHQVTIAAPGKSPLARKAAQTGIEVVGDVEFRRGFHPLSFFHDVYVLRRCYLAAPFDVVHLHGSQDSWACAFAFREVKDRISIVRTKHNLFPIRDHALNRWLYGKCIDHIVCISGEVYRDCAVKSYISAERLSVIHSAVRSDLLEADEGVKDLREEWHIGQKFCVGTIGRLREEKGHRFLLQAIAKVVTEQRNL